MELFSHVTGILLPFIVLTGALIALLLRFSCSRTPAAQWPPGPPAWPIIGHLHLLGPLPHQSLSKLAQSYGPLMGLRLGGVPAIVATTAEMAKQILHTHDLAFASHPRNAAAVHMLLDADVVSTPYGSTWRQMRQICSLELFNAKRLASFRHVREEEVRNLARAVLEAGERGHKKVKLRAPLQATTNNIICRMVMGKKMEDVSSQSATGKIDFLSLVEEIHHLMGVLYVGDFIPWLWWVDPHRYLARMKAIGRRTRAHLQDIIDKRLQHGSDAIVEDFLDILLAHNYDKISESNVMGLVLDMFTAGTQTSSAIAEWTLAELINNPTKMHKLQEELERVVGKLRFVTEEDIENLPYLGMVVKESMRLHPVGPLLIPHESIKECQIKGYKIAAQTRVFVNAWEIGRDPSTWQNPLQFWPERFLLKNVDLRDSSCELVPFGYGRRACPGWNLGILNTQLMVATLIQGFTFTLDCSLSHDDDKVVDMSEASGVLLEMATPLCPFATSMLPLHLY